MIDLSNIEQYIDSRLNSDDPAISKNKDLLAALERIKLQIEFYKETKNPQNLLEIRRFIESIRLNALSRSFSAISLFSSQNNNSISMGSILASKGFDVLTHPHERLQICEANGMPGLILSASTEDVLGWIYQTIRQKLPISTIQWDYALVPNKTGEITNTQIAAWQKGMQTITSEYKAIDDFRRDVKIMGENPRNFASNEDVIKQIRLLLSKSSYTDEQKLRIEKWLAAKGGQEMNFFISDMLNEQTLFLVPEAMMRNNDENILAPRSDADTSWELDKDGKIVYYQNMHIKSIVNRGDSIMGRLNNGEIKVINDCTNPDFETILLNNKSNASNYLASINASARLDITEKTITPTVTSLNVISQTNMLAPTHAVSRFTAAAAAATPRLRRPDSSPV